MLEEMDKELDHTDSRLKALTSRVQTAIRKSGGKKEREKERSAYCCKKAFTMYVFVSVIMRPRVENNFWNVENTRQ